jgi:hypothetical protein
MGALEKYDFEYRLTLYKLKPDECQKHRCNFSVLNLYRLHECNLFNNMGT